MITDRNKLTFVTIQWLWFLCLILVSFKNTNTWMHYAEATQHQQQPQQQQLKTTLQLQQEVKSNGPQQQKQQDVTVRNFSPRMDYNNNEWRPVGRGDPLKNDPTFDYSPPTLDRVRYWADSDKDKEKPDDVSAALIDAKLKKANPGKNEILLLGVTGDRLRGGSSLQQYPPNVVKNAKGETPLLQPKYTSIRRSYYAHQLPTHLMPPPMQPMLPATQQHQLQSPNMQQQLQPQHQQPQALHIVKPAQTEYRHNMPVHSFMTSSPTSMHSKPHYASTATQPWMHTSSSPSMGTSVSSSHSPLAMSSNSHRYSYPHSHALDSHHQESLNHLSYHNRPSLTSTPSIMLGVNIGMGHSEFHSPNSIRGVSSGHKSTSTSSRKPWIHDLLKKEFIKPVKPSQNPNSYNIEAIKSSYAERQQFGPISRPQGISTTFAPVTFVTPTSTSTTSTTQIYITSTSPKPTISTSPSPMYSSTLPTHTTHAPRTTSTLSPTRLLIPNTSNLAYRPTVAPLKMTTDSLFSHYNQPEKPLRGPMYLIIEGHSKVKTYGKDELDPHKPKIVPIIPKREPVVRMADPNEKRGTPETFQVKHLHIKPKEATTSAAPVKQPTTKKSNTSTTTTTTTTRKPTIPKNNITVKPKATSKPTTTAKTTPKQKTSTTASFKPITTKSAPKLSVTATLTKPQLEKPADKELKSSIQGDKSFANNLKMSAKISSPNALDTSQKPSQQAVVSTPPTGMQGLLSFLDSSLGSFFKEENTQIVEKGTELTDTTTKLKPIPIKPVNAQQPVEARISTKLDPIRAEDYEDYENDNYFQMTTEYLPRETRQVFDYDPLPESRIGLKDDANFGTFLEHIDDEDDVSALNLDDEYDDDEDENEEPDQEQDQATLNSLNSKHGPIKRIDSLVSSSTEDDDFDDISALVADDLSEEDLANLARNQQRQNEAKKA